MESFIHNLDKININYYFAIIDEYCTTKNINHLISNYKNSIILKNKNKSYPQFSQKSIVLCFVMRDNYSSSLQ